MKDSLGECLWHFKTGFSKPFLFLLPDLHTGGPAQSKRRYLLELYVSLKCLFFQAGYVSNYMYVQVNRYEQQQKWHSVALTVFKIACNFSLLYVLV
jgi:hypothetical protein